MSLGALILLVVKALEEYLNTLAESTVDTHDSRLVRGRITNFLLAASSDKILTRDGEYLEEPDISEIEEELHSQLIFLFDELPQSTKTRIWKQWNSSAAESVGSNKTFEAVFVAARRVLLLNTLSKVYHYLMLYDRAEEIDCVSTLIDCLGDSKVRFNVDLLTLISYDIDKVARYLEGSVTEADTEEERDFNEDADADDGLDLSAAYEGVLPEVMNIGLGPEHFQPGNRTELPDEKYRIKLLNKLLEDYRAFEELWLRCN